MQNIHSVISDMGTLSLVRNAENTSDEIRRGFEKRDQRVAAFKLQEAKRRRKVLKESVRAIQQKMTNSYTMTQFAAELSVYQPPLEPVTAGDEDISELPELLDALAHEESEALKSIVGSFREGMSIQKLLLIAKAAKHSEEEKYAQQSRTERLLRALQVDKSDPVFRGNIESVLSAKDHLPTPRDISAAVDDSDDDDDSTRSDSPMEGRHHDSDGGITASSRRKFDDVDDETIFQFLASDRSSTASRRARPSASSLVPEIYSFSK